MGLGTAFGKTILIGDQFVLKEVPAIVSSIPFETECRVERLDEGDGWILEDNRVEVPGYKKKKEHQQVDSINHMLEVMQIDVKKNPIKITFGGSLLAGSGVGASAAHCVSLARALNEEFNLGLSIDEINLFRLGRRVRLPRHAQRRGQHRFNLRRPFAVSDQKRRKNLAAHQFEAACRSCLGQQRGDGRHLETGCPCRIAGAKGSQAVSATHADYHRTGV